jgi:hypothetical protein
MTGMNDAKRMLLFTTVFHILLVLPCTHAFGINLSAVGGQRHNYYSRIHTWNSFRHVKSLFQTHHSFSSESMDSSRRRSFIQIITTILALGVPTIHPVNAAVGTLPEFSDTNAILQGITVDVTQEDQLQDMISFLKEGFTFKVLRQRTHGTITDTVCLFELDSILFSLFTINHIVTFHINA